MSELPFYGGESCVDISWDEYYDRDPAGAMDVATVAVEDSAPRINALFVRPFALETEVHRKAAFWEANVAIQYGVALKMQIADPPFQTDDLGVKWYWLKPDGHTHDNRVKKLKSEVSSALITLLGEVEKFRPRVLKVLRTAH